nr:hypothetical protein 19 [Candidatus Omnitrophota bacterium]
MTLEEIDNLKNDADTDALVAEKIFGVKVVGFGPGAYIEGEVLAWPDSEGHFLCVDRRPYYIERCMCEYAEKHKENKKKYFGHDELCLSVIPDYCTDIRDAWAIIEEIGSSMTWDIVTSSEGTHAKISGVPILVDTDGKEGSVESKGGPNEVCLTICKAALKTAILKEQHESKSESS